MKLDRTRAGVPQTAEAVAARWFAQDMFADPALADEERVPEEAHASAAAVHCTGGPGLLRGAVHMPTVCMLACKLGFMELPAETPPEQPSARVLGARCF